MHTRKTRPKEKIKNHKEKNTKNGNLERLLTFKIKVK